MYQLEKDEGSEFSSAIVHTGPSPSKMSLTAQMVKRISIVFCLQNFIPFVFLIA